jgi:hypothetical protein
VRGRIMKMNLELFKLLNDIAAENGISQEKWGESSGIPQPRISEFSVQLKGGKLNQSRYFTLKRFLQLYVGLKTLLGESKLKQALMAKAEGQGNVAIEMWAKLALLLESDDKKEKEKIVKLKMFVDMLLKE